jgi:hypothetical protein
MHVAWETTRAAIIGSDPATDRQASTGGDADATTTLRAVPHVPINRRPRITWPNSARVALWVIPNIETFPLNEPVPGGTGKAPDIINWAPRDYGNRVGIFRIMDVLARHGMRGPLPSTARCDDYPQIVEDAVTLGWSSWATTRAIHAPSISCHRRRNATSCSVLSTRSRRRRERGRRAGCRPASGKLAYARLPRGSWSPLCRRLGQR